MDNYIKGIQYEKQIKKHLLVGHSQVYLWNDIPLDVFMESKIYENYHDKLEFRRSLMDETNNKHRVLDTGCDIFYHNEKEKKWLIVQCKNYKQTITQAKLAGFYGMLCSVKLHGELYYTSKLSRVITQYKQPDIKFIRHPYQEEKKVNEYTKLKPYKYQEEAYEKLKLHKRAIFQLPCGMGKTLVMIMLAKLYDIIIIFSPLRVHAQQNLERFRNEIDDYDHYELVDSDGTRDVNELKPLLNKKTILSVTYKSCDIIEQLIKYIKTKSVGVFIDEFHNLTCDNIMDKNNTFYKVLSQDYNYLFVSATPKIYEPEDDNYIDNEDITGEIQYSYEFGKAINKGHICDYDVFVPDMTLKDEEHLSDVYKHLNIKDLSCVSHDVRAHFLLRCMEENGHSKCICYSKDIDDAEKLMKSFERMKEYHCMDLYVEKIVSGVSQKNRERILDEFSETHKKAILCSVRILDECVDIPKCDSVFMTSKQTNQTRTIQRVCRANRKDKDNVNKKTGVYMWCNSYDQMVDLITNLKEFDSSFTTEKVKICGVKDNEKRCVKSRDDVVNKEVYLGMDKVIVNMSRVDAWSEMLAKVKMYIEKNGQRPPDTSKNSEIRRMGRWISYQLVNYKKRECIMKSDEIYKTWNTFMNCYIEHFKSNEEIWDDNLEKVKNYIDSNKCRPGVYSKDYNTKKMGVWVSTQLINSKKRINIMKSNEIYDKWNTFIRDYSDYFKSSNEAWNELLEKVENYIDKNQRRPSIHSKDEEIKKMGNWISIQLKHSKTRQYIMKSNEIYDRWNVFMDKYSDYFKNNVDVWYEMLEKVKTYIDQNYSRPRICSKGQETQRMGRWIATQLTNAKNRTNIMKYNEIYNKWIEFVDKYKKYF